MRKWFVQLSVLILSTLILSGCSRLSFLTKSGIQVISNDVAASVLLDGKTLDKTPYINKTIQPGTYTLEVKPDDPSYPSYETKVTLRRGFLTVLNIHPGKRPETTSVAMYEMEPTKDSKHAEISITTIPDGGITNVDGEPKGFAPVLVDKVTPGEHTYTIRLTGYVDMQDEINVSEGTRMIATVKLAKQEGALESGTPTSATPSTTASASTILASPTPKLTATPKPSASPKLASPSASPKTATISATPTKVATGPKVRINATGYFQNGQEVLRVRATPTASGTELGFAPKGNEYVYLKETTADGWRKIQFNGQAGWVSGQYTTVTE